VADPNKKEYKTRAVYIMVPRKLVITAITAYVCLFIGVAGSIQWANYVDRRSNQRLCGVIVLSNEAYKSNPRPTPVGQKLGNAMEKLSNDYDCK